MLFEEVQEVFRAVFENPDMVITEDLSAEDVGDWTSLVHMVLLSTLEEKYGIKFSTRDIRKMKKVGDLITCIERKINQ